MVDINFDTALKYVLRDEGGNDDDPHDHGGRTSRGITQREYDAWCRLNGKDQGDVWLATDEDIRSIYQSQYWNPYCDAITSGPDYLFFDISVNAGRTQAVRQFQKALGVKVDGMMGQVTMDAINQMDPVDLVQAVSDVRRNFYRSLSQFPRYGKGWLSRVNHCEKGAVALANCTDYDTPEVIKHTKATGPATTTISPETSGGAAVATGGLLQTLDTFRDELSKFTDMQYIKYALIALAVASLSYSVYGFYQRSKVQAAQ